LLVSKEILADIFPEISPEKIVTSKVIGGFINECYKIEIEDNTYFLKLNEADKFPQMFEKEARGLQALNANTSLQIPKVEKVGITEHQQYLLLEFVQKGYKTKQFWVDFAEGIAQLHQNTHPFFGFEEDNFIGSLPQINKLNENWCEFFITQRLQPQIKIALDNQLIDKWFATKFESFFHILPSILPDEKPALLHGDLWHGNYIINQEGKPCIFDPAVNYGCSEQEIAFTELFGQMDDLFYETYFEIKPSFAGYEERADIYNLYPLLVHANLFGQMYLTGIEQIVKRFIG